MLPQEFRAAGITCGIKDSGKSDLALFVSDVPAAAAGVFTTNRVVGAPVEVSRGRVPASGVRAIVINSGNANACTGQQGHDDALGMTALAAELLKTDADNVLVCSTGIIGVALPMDVIREGLPRAVEGLHSNQDALPVAAEAMMTTDTFAKHVSVGVELSTGDITICGAAKGAAMIAPNMATMLAVVMTDAAILPDDCHSFLRAAVGPTFNSITVDGHMSTSDTVLLLANGATGCSLVTDDDRAAFMTALQTLCEKMATDIIRDAEGGAHFVTIDVEGFDNSETARKVARQIAESALVKTAIAGNDPNWGRITSAAGYAGIPFDVNYLSLQINDVDVYAAGVPTAYDEGALSKLMAQGDVQLRLVLAGGPCSGSAFTRFWTSDLTQEYVRLNSEYTT